MDFLVLVAPLLLAVYAALAVRHIWQGTDHSRAGTTQAELNCDTVALIALGGACLAEPPVRTARGGIWTTGTAAAIKRAMMHRPETCLRAIAARITGPAL